MTNAFDVPSYVQGYRFADGDDRFYEAETKTFRDLAGYGPLADLKITTGTPVFETVSGFRCLRLNNTFHGQFSMPIPWMGSVIVVVKPITATGSTVSRYPVLFGNSVTASSNGRLRVGHFSGARSLNWETPSAVLVASRSRNDDNLVVAGFATDQETRKGYATIDGATIVESGPVAGTTDGNGPAMQSGQFGARFGDMDNDPANLTEITDLLCNIFEIHFFADNIWVKHLTQAAAFMTALRTRYGVV